MVFVLAMPLFSFSSSADEGFDSEFDEKPWAGGQALAAGLSPGREPDSVSRRISRTETKYLIDGNSLSVGADSGDTLYLGRD